MLVEKDYPVLNCNLDMIRQMLQFKMLHLQYTFDMMAYNLITKYEKIYEKRVGTGKELSVWKHPPGDGKKL